MKIFHLIVFVLYLSNQVAYCADEDEFVDPLDMLNYDRIKKSMKKPITKTVSDPIQNDRCTVFLLRFINILLKNTGILSLNPQSNEGGNIELQSFASITLSVQDLQFLKNMASHKDIDYREIDRILLNMFTAVKEKTTEFESISSHSDIYIQVKEVLYWISIGSISIFLLYIIFHKVGLVFNITFVVIVLFALAFASTWYTMYKKAEINRSVHLEHMPSHCYKKTQNWLPISWFNTIDLEECKKYKEAIHLDPKYSIALTEVFAEMFSKVLLKPLETLGESIYKFNKSVLKDFPLWAQIILIPIIIIIVIKTLLLSCALLVGRHLSMKSIFGYGSTSIGPMSTINEQSNRCNNSIHPVTSAQYSVAQMPEVPKVNFNINVFHPNSTTDNSNKILDSSYIPSSFNNKFKINYKEENDLISMLKNKEIDSVDSKECKVLQKKNTRHRTLSI